MHQAIDIANYFLSLVDLEAGDSMSNLKLQKLLYYAQGAHLAITARPLFADAIVAWEHGPVIPDLYHHFKRYGADPIPSPEEGIDLERYSPETREILDDVFEVYGQFSPWKLRNMTREEQPWKDTPINSKISHEALRNFFVTRLVETPQTT